MDFKSHIISLYGKDFYNSMLKARDMPCQSALFLNNEKIDDVIFFNEFNLQPHQYIEHAYIFDKNQIPLGKSYLHNAGAYYIQDPAAMMVAHLLNVKDDDIVLDMCAAPGGKTIQLSLKMHNNGVIVANDISYQRALTLSSNVERMGRKNVVVTNDDFSKKSDNFINTFTKIILDAPCSGSGMFRKEPKMEEDWSYEKVLRCAELQKELITSAYKMLKPGGVLSYSTCSYSKEENEDIVNYLLNNSDAKILQLSLKDQRFNSIFLKDALLFTISDFGEGQFICQLQKPGELEYSSKSTEKYDRKHECLRQNFNLSGQIFTYNNSYYLAPFAFPLPNIKIIRPFLKIGEYKGSDFIPDYHLSHYLSSKASISLDDNEKNLYLAGESFALKKPFSNGFHLVSYKNINLGYGKVVNNVLKNHYPKGLRIR